MSDRAVTSYIECLSASGDHYIVRWSCNAASLEDAQAQTIEHLGDHRSLPTGPGGTITSIESCWSANVLRQKVVRRDVPLFELAT